jgi:hypothetical protein
MTDILSPVAADIVGLIGSGLMVIAYIYSNMVKTVDFVTFNLLNLVGAILLFMSLTVHFNMASMALEIVWMTIALLGLVKALRARRLA